MRLQYNNAAAQATARCCECAMLLQAAGCVRGPARHCAALRSPALLGTALRSAKICANLLSSLHRALQDAWSFSGQDMCIHSVKAHAGFSLWPLNTGHRRQQQQGRQAEGTWCFRSGRAQAEGRKRWNVKILRAAGTVRFERQGRARLVRCCVHQAPHVFLPAHVSRRRHRAHCFAAGACLDACAPLHARLHRFASHLMKTVSHAQHRLHHLAARPRLDARALLPRAPLT